MNNKGPDQSVQMLGLTWPFDVCIAKGRFSGLVAPSTDDLTKKVIMHMQKVKKQINCSIAQIDKPLYFSLLNSNIFLVSKFEISYLLPSFITYLSVNIYISNLSFSSPSVLENPSISFCCFHSCCSFSQL